MLKVPGTEDKWATRIVRKNLHYDSRNKLFRWKRYAVHTDESGATIQTPVPWPSKVTTSVNPPDNSTLVSDAKEESWLPWDPDLHPARG